MIEDNTMRVWDTMYGDKEIDVASMNPKHVMRFMLYIKDKIKYNTDSVHH